MSPRLTASSHNAPSAASSLALANCLIALSWRRSSAFWISLAAALRPRGEGDALLVQVVVVGGLGAGDAELDHQAAQLGARQAGADDRAVHARVHVPDRGAALRGRRDELGAAPIAVGMRAFIGIAPRAKGIAGRPVEKMLDSMSGARDVMVALYP